MASSRTLLTSQPHSCRAPPWDLDGEYSEYPRTEEHTETLAQSSSVAALWRDHGIVLDVIVSYQFVIFVIQKAHADIYSHLQMIFLRLIYMSY